MGKENATAGQSGPRARPENFAEASPTADTFKKNWNYQVALDIVSFTKVSCIAVGVVDEYPPCSSWTGIACFPNPCPPKLDL
jgi:hypothetical protein